jgi:ribose transport system substrate-binding protein
MSEPKLSRRQFLKLSGAALGAAGALTLTGCQTAPAAAPEAAAAVPEVKQLDQTYVWLCAVTGISFWLDGRKGMEAAGASLGVKTEFLGPQEYDASQQLKVLDSLIGRKPAGIMIFPADVASLSDTMKRAMKEGIPVMCVNSDVSDQSARYGFVGPDNRGVGRTGGQIVADLLEGKGNVAIMTVPGIEVHESRKGGYLDVFEKYPDIKILDVVDDKSDPSYGVTVANQLITAYPDLDLIVGTDATAGAAIARALKETGMAGKIKCVAMDRDQDMLPYVEDGTITATLAQNSVMEEWMATHFLYWLTNNTIPEFADWRAAGAPQAPHYTDIGVSVVTKDNVQFYKKAA